MAARKNGSRNEVHINHPLVDQWTWGGWRLVMKANGEENDQWIKRNGPGYRLNSATLARYFPPSCGIYEIKCTKAHHVGNVVYVGKTCVCAQSGKNCSPGHVHARISQYASDGSHLRDRIDDNLRKGYNIWFRVRESKTNPEIEEQLLLRDYEYNWNVQNN